MKQFIFTVRDPLGIHAKPAGLIARLAKEYGDTSIVLTCNGRQAKAASFMKLMRLGAEAGNVITITAEGTNEDAAIIAISDFVQNHL